MLMAVLVYLYTVIAFNFFRKFYTKEEDEEKEENCKDMFTVSDIHLVVFINHRCVLFSVLNFIYIRVFVLVVVLVMN